MTNPLDDMFGEPAALPRVDLDRSTIEAYAACPFQGWAVETGAVDTNSAAAQAGTEVHAVIGEALDWYATNGHPPRDYLEQERFKMRPDVSADALAGLRKSIYGLDRLITARNPDDLLVYQGGTGERSGQLAVELLPATQTAGAIYATSEIDLLLAGASAVEVDEIDFKSGQTEWTAAKVRASFQFNLHAILIFARYPDCQAVNTSIYMTRFNRLTNPVSFTRAGSEPFTGRLLQALEYRRIALAAVAEGGTAEAWPLPDKCGLCPAVLMCPAAFAPCGEIARDPVRYAKNTHVLELFVGARKNGLRDYIEAHGTITDGEGFAYGKPDKVDKRATAAAYKGHADPMIEASHWQPQELTGDPMMVALQKEIDSRTATDSTSGGDTRRP